MLPLIVLLAVTSADFEFYQLSLWDVGYAVNIISTFFATNFMSTYFRRMCTCRCVGNNLYFIINTSIYFSDIINIAECVYTYEQTYFNFYKCKWETYTGRA
jgi:hypothetical protein